MSSSERVGGRKCDRNSASRISASASSGRALENCFAESERRAMDLRSIKAIPESGSSLEDEVLSARYTSDRTERITVEANLSFDFIADFNSDVNRFRRPSAPEVGGSFDVLAWRRVASVGRVLKSETELADSAIVVVLL